MVLFIDPTTLPAGFGGCTQVVFLGAVYSYVLFTASNLIADGSDLLLLIPSWEKLVGSIVLPILGAVPDGAMVVFSGLGDNAKEEIAVGVGTLAGSTIMLLTIPFAASIYYGRVPTSPDGKPDYSLSQEPLSSAMDGAVTNSEVIQKSGNFMGLTSLSYLIVQIPAIYFLIEKFTKKETVHSERGFLLVAIAACAFFFVYYIYECYSDSLSANNVVVMSKKGTTAVDLLRKGIESLEDTFDRVLEEYERDVNAENEGNFDFTKPLIVEDDVASHLKVEVKSVLLPLFEQCDHDGDGFIQYEEAFYLLSFFGACGHGPGAKQNISDIFQRFDRDLSGGLDQEEFFELVWTYIQKKAARKALMSLKVAEEGNEEVSEGSIPEEFVHLGASERQRKIIARAFSMLIVGTVLVLSFSDPMVGVLNELGTRWGISAFYLSFVVAPLASNAAEAIASTQFSQKKSLKTIDVSFSALTGAAIMNNTFCLLVFVVLCFVQKLEWTFGPETFSILFVQACMYFMTRKSYYTIRDALFILALYPASLIIVSILK